MPGYSGTPLFKKLGIKQNYRLFVKNAPEEYMGLIAPVPEGVCVLKKVGRDLNIIHLFTKSRGEMTKLLPDYIQRIKQDGMIWLSWPKKASKVPTDVTEDVIREVAIPLGLVDVKVCAVDKVWSGLKLVIRKELRSK